MQTSKSIYLLIVIALPFCVRAQGLLLTPGARLVAKGNPTLVLNNGSLINNGGFSADSSTVLFAGEATATATIGGSIPISFYNLTIGKTSSDVQLNSNTGVTGFITMASGHLQLNNYTLDLGHSGSIIGERSDSYITGGEGGSITATAVLMAPRAVNPGNIGVEINSPENLGSTLITRGHTTQISYTGIQRYFEIEPTFNTNLHATLRFFYLDGETGGNRKDALSLFSSNSHQGQWLVSGKDAGSATDNWVAKTGLDQLHGFTLAIPNFKPTGKTAAAIYPNPTHESFRLLLTVPSEKEVLISLCDQTGHVLQIKKIQCQTGTNTIDWPIAQLAAGIYHLSFKNMEMDPVSVIKQ